MTQSEFVERLEKEWDQPSGFFARLRVGDFDADQPRVVLALMSDLVQLFCYGGHEHPRGEARCPMIAQWDSQG
jgi:hypothetical protein